MADVKVLDAVDIGGDVLLVLGTVDGREVAGFGWVSATRRAFAPEDYYPEGTLEADADGFLNDISGHRKPDAKGVPMDAEALAAYHARVLEEASA